MNNYRGNNNKSYLRNKKSYRWTYYSGNKSPLRRSSYSHPSTDHHQMDERSFIDDKLMDKLIFEYLIKDLNHNSDDAGDNIIVNDNINDDTTEARMNKDINKRSLSRISMKERITRLRNHCSNIRLSKSQLTRVEQLARLASLAERMYIFFKFLLIIICQ